MNWPLFVTLIGFLLPVSLALRLLTVLARPLGQPATIWRIQLVLLLAVPIVASTPGAMTLLSATPTRAGAASLGFMATGWGSAKVVLSAVGVIFIDATKPRLLEQLCREPISTAWPSRSYLLRDAGVIAVCLVLAWAATWSVR